MFESLTLSQWAVLALSALCIGMSKTGVQGLMLLIVPYMALAFGAKESTGVILPMLCMADIIAVVYYKRIADWRMVVKLLPTAIVGFFVAIAVDKMVPVGTVPSTYGMDLGSGSRCDDLERGLWQRESMDEPLVVFGNLWPLGRLHNHDWQCCGTRYVGLSALYAKGKDGVHWHQRLVLLGGQFA